MGDAIILALSKKGKASKDMSDDKEPDMEGEGAKREHLKAIFKDLLDAFESKDEEAGADLLEELGECLKEDY